jgi:hypothetical protein
MKSNQESATQLAVLRASLNQLETILSVKMDQQLSELREACNDPTVFLAHMAPTLPDKRVTLTDWAFLCTLLDWDSPHNFQDNDGFQAFLDSIVHVGTAPIGSPIVAEVSPGDSANVTSKTSSDAPLVPGSTSSSTEAPNVPGTSSGQVAVETVEG